MLALLYLLSFRSRSMLNDVVVVVCRKALPVGHGAKTAIAQRHPVTTVVHVILGVGGCLALVFTMLITVCTRDFTNWKHCIAIVQRVKKFSMIFPGKCDWGDGTKHLVDLCTVCVTCGRLRSNHYTVKDGGRRKKRELGGRRVDFQSSRSWQWWSRREFIGRATVIFYLLSVLASF